MQPSHEKQRREREPDRSGHDQPFQYGHQRARRPTENAGAEPAFIAAEDRARPIAVQANRLPERAVPNIVTRKIEPEVTNARCTKNPPTARRSAISLRRSAYCPRPRPLDRSRTVAAATMPYQC